MLLLKMRSVVSEVTELEDGFRYQFPIDGDVLSELAKLISGPPRDY
jgi:hypothetical protein